MLGAGPIALAFPIEKVFRFSKTSKALAYGAQEAEHDRQHMIESDCLGRVIRLQQRGKLRSKLIVVVVYRLAFR
jgi:hypothetical protein